MEKRGLPNKASCSDEIATHAHSCTEIDYSGCRSPMLTVPSFKKKEMQPNSSAFAGEQNSFEDLRAMVYDAQSCNCALRFHFHEFIFVHAGG